MLLRRLLALATILVLVFSVFSVLGFAKIGKDNSDKSGGVSWTWIDEQGSAKVGVPVQWTRTITVINDNNKDKKIKIRDFPKNTIFIPRNSNLDYKKNDVGYIAPVGTSTVVIDYTTPAPTVRKKVTVNNATHYLFDFVVDADTDAHYSDVDVPFDVPGTSWDWNYFINWKQPDGSLAKQKLYAANTDGDKTTYEKIGWRAPHLSEQQGGGGGQKSPSKIRNYDLETTRAANASLPELWYHKGNADTGLADDLDWPYLPISNPGYQSGTSILVKNGVHDGRMYAEPINGTGSTFSIEFKYLPDFPNEACEIYGGTEILFGNGEGDTTYIFAVQTGDETWTTNDFVIEKSNLNQGWKLLKMNSTVAVPSDEYIRFFFSTESCSAGNSLLIDDVIIN